MIRYAALAFKPALIWLLLISGSTEESAEVGKLMLSAAIISIVLGNESHLVYYRLRFSGNSSPIVLHRTFRKYLRSLYLHILVLLPFVFIAANFLFPSIEISFLLALGITERVTDEVLRIKLYKKEWSKWTVLLLIKHAAPSAVTLIVSFLFPAWAPNAYVLSSMLFCIYIILKKTDREVPISIKKTINRRINIGEVLIYSKTYLKKLFPRQLTAVISVNFLLLDRLVGMNYWSSEQIGLVIMFGQIIGGLFFLAEVKYLSEKRSEFIDSRLRFKEFWHWKPYLKLIAICGLLSLMVIYFGEFSKLLPIFSKKDTFIAPLLIISSMLYYSVIPLNDYLYYRGATRLLVWMHVALSAIYCFVGLLILTNQSPVALTGLLIGLLFLRASLLAIFFMWHERSAEIKS